MVFLVDREWVHKLISKMTFSKFLFLNENDRIPIQISLKFVARSPIDNKPVLVQLMAWRRISDKPLSEPMLSRLTDEYAALGGDELLAQIIATIV